MTRQRTALALGVLAAALLLVSPSAAALTALLALVLTYDKNLTKEIDHDTDRL